MRVYVINLAVARHRLAHMERILGEAGIRFERFDAVDAGRAIAHRCFKMIPPMVERRWTADELGCLLSRYEVWCRIAAGPDRFGAVMEDDLFVDPRLKSLLDGEIRLPSDADLIKLETVAAKISISRLTRYGSQGFRIHRLRSLHCGTGAYLISRAANIAPTPSGGRNSILASDERATSRTNFSERWIARQQRRFPKAMCAKLRRCATACFPRWSADSIPPRNIFSKKNSWFPLLWLSGCSRILCKTVQI